MSERGTLKRQGESQHVDSNKKRRTKDEEMRVQDQDSEIAKLLKSIQLTLDEVKSDVSELKSDVAELKSDVSELKFDVARHTGQLNDIGEKCGFLFEVAAADEIRRLYGERFARHFVAKDISGLARFAISKEDFTDPFMFDTNRARIGAKFSNCAY